MRMMAIRDLTPYDTGDRLEPKPWVDPARRITGNEYQRPAEDHDYGRVDFDDDSGATVAIVWGTRNEDGGYAIHVHDFNTDEEHTVLVGV